MTPDDLGLLTYAEAADRLGVKPATIRKWVGRYDLPTQRIGDQTYVVELPLLKCDRDRRRSLATRGGQRRLAEAGDSMSQFLPRSTMPNSAPLPASPRCTATDERGFDCDKLADSNAPVRLCAGHLRDAYLYVHDHLVAHASNVVELQPKRPAVRHRVRESVIYYLRFGDRIKIGTTADLTGRLLAIPHDELLATEPGGEQLERMRHAQFADARVRGEWFTASEDLLSHIEMLRKHYAAAQASH